MPQLPDGRRKIINLDTIGSNLLFSNRISIRSFTNTNQLALQSASKTLLGSMASLQQTIDLFFGPLRRTLEVFQAPLNRVMEQIRQMHNQITKPLTLLFSRQPIYLVQPRPVTHERQIDNHLSVTTNNYGFFVIGGKQLTVLHPASSRCGKLLAALLERRAQFVDYKTLQDEMGSGDRKKAFKDLKYQLKKQGYELDYALTRTKGIALIGIKKLQ